jgi:hypothetical protein
MPELCTIVQFVQHPHAFAVQYHAVVARDWKKSTLAQRVEYLLETMESEAEWDEAELARQMGAKGQSTVQHWRLGRNKRMQSRFAWPLQDKHRWSARWLLDGDGEPRMPYVEAEKRKLIETVSTLPADRLRALVTLIGA